MISGELVLEGMVAGEIAFWSPDNSVSVDIKNYLNLDNVHSSRFKFPEAKHRIATTRSGCSRTKPITAHAGHISVKTIIYSRELPKTSKQIFQKIKQKNKIHELYSSCFKIPEAGHVSATT
ncbi:MAG: hypothetical protein LBJ00_09985 [Planctomycetaceae bacterium]|nr:hypothetical protein [Planctomycetaceae bacterium]